MVFSLKLSSISPTFYVQIFDQYPYMPKNTNTIFTEKLRKTFSYKNVAKKMLMKLTLTTVTFKR